MLQEICRKDRYETKQAAEKARRHKWLKIYRCPHCDGFHFTHKKPLRKTDTEKVFTASVPQLFSRSCGS
jgi:hypothetical protein